MKVVTVVGARPQFIKAALISMELRLNNINEVLIHTGQHYDANMSDVFFTELNIPKADYQLGIGSGPHGMQTGRMLEALENILLSEKPDWVLVYGDTNSTLAGALAAAKLHIPVVHVEAGLRSYNRVMPEEINRKLTDHCSTLLLCPTKTAIHNLEREGFGNIFNNGNLIELQSINEINGRLSPPFVLNVGDVMCDLLIKTMPSIEGRSPELLNKYHLAQGEYGLVTIHRAENTDDIRYLAGIVKALASLKTTVIWPLHPRTKNRLEKFGLIRDLRNAANVIIIGPVGYVEMLLLLQKAQFVITDSGGLQKEAYMLGVPCLTCRNETEWVETVEAGWNKIIGLGATGLQQALPIQPPKTRLHLYGDGFAARRVVMALTKLRAGK